MRRPTPPHPGAAPSGISKTGRPPAAPPAGHAGPLPWVRLRSAGFGPQLYKRMLGDVDAAARPGDIVAVYDKSDAPYGVGQYNPKSLISLRLLTRELAGFDPDAFFSERIGRAVEFRRDVLQLDRSTDAYRLVYDQGDGLPGLVVDRYGSTFALEFYTLGMFRQAERLEKAIAARFPGAKFVHRASQYTETMEGFRVRSGAGFRERIRENGVLFDVAPTEGYKTGFFCDQRENRLAAAAFAPGRRVLDLFCYVGGFGIYAKKLGRASEVTCVELDPEACEAAKRNANINQVRLETVRVDAFPYLRQAAANRERWGLVILDPYKLIHSKEGYRLGRQKYLDLNRLALGVLEEGGILVTCSCSGMLPWDEFQQIVRTAAGSARRRLQIFRKSGAGPDHPFSPDYPEGEYLKALWCRAL